MKTAGHDRRRKRIGIAVGAVLAGLTIGAGSARAGPPVEFLIACTPLGVGYFYIPGTAICQNANQIADNQYDINRDFSRAMLGVAMSSAIVTPFVPEGTTFAISVHWATYDGKNAAGLATALRLLGNWVLTGGMAFGFDKGTVTLATIPTEPGPFNPVRSWSSVTAMARLGIEYSW